MLCIGFVGNKAKMNTELGSLEKKHSAALYCSATCCESFE